MNDIDFLWGLLVFFHLLLTFMSLFNVLHVLGTMEYQWLF